MLVVAAFCVFAAIRFILIGAWPVVIFVAIDLMALWLAFHLNYRAARAYETVRLSDRDLILTRVSAGGRVMAWRFEPYWVKVLLTTVEPEDNELSLSSHGETVVFGQFLTADERRDLKTALLVALERWRGRHSALQ